MRPVILLLLIAGTPDAADGPPARVSVELSPEGGALVGQRVTFAITLSTPDLFAGVPTFEMPPIPGAVVLPPAGSPVVGSETTGETTFTTQRHEFAVYAQRAGTVKIPAFGIHFDTNAGFGKPMIRRRVTTEPASFLAETPPGAEGLGTVIAARRLEVTDEWRPEPESPRVGDAFTRTLTVSADDAPGMIFPPFRLEGVDGLAAYPKGPAVEDRNERGALTGRRIEAITYVCKTEGTVHVPGRTLTWYDLDARGLKSAEVPGRTFTVVPPTRPAPAPGPAEAGSKLSPGRPWGIAAIVAVLALCGFLALRLWPRCVKGFAVWNESEAASFARLRRACRSGDPHSAFVALLRWLDRFGPMSLDEFARRAGDPEAAAAVAALSDRVYDRPEAAHLGAWSGHHLFARIARARRKLRPVTSRAERGPLPPLNPAH